MRNKQHQALDYIRRAGDTLRESIELLDAAHNILAISTDHGQEIRDLVTIIGHQQGLIDRLAVIVKEELEL